MTLPFLTIVGINIFSGGAFLNYMPGVAAGVIAVIICMGVLFGVVAFKFHNDIAAGRRERIVHAMILAAVMFFLGSNIAGIIVGIGARFCAIRRLERWRRQMPDHSLKRPAMRFAWYVIIMSAPARFMPVRNSAITAFSSIHPSIAAAFTSAYSPDTL